MSTHMHTHTLLSCSEEDAQTSHPLTLPVQPRMPLGASPVAPTPGGAHLVVLAMHHEVQHDEVVAVAGRLHVEQEAMDEVLDEAP